MEISNVQEVANSATDQMEAFLLLAKEVNNRCSKVTDEVRRKIADGIALKAADELSEIGEIANF